MSTKSAVVGPATHAVIARPEGPADQHGDLGNRRGGDRRDQLCTIFCDAARLVFLTHHKAGDVLQEDERDIALRAQLDKVRTLHGAFGKQHAIVGNDAAGQAVDMCEAANQRRAVARLELVKA